MILKELFVNVHIPLCKDRSSAVTLDATPIIKYLTLIQCHKMQEARHEKIVSVR